MQKIYSGFLEEGGWGEAFDILYLVSKKGKDSDEPLAEILEEDFGGKQVSVSYYICNSKCTLEEAQESFIKSLVGIVDTNVGAKYSEITGFLWADEEINIGGHDLIEELHNYKGKWLILVVDIYEGTGIKPGKNTQEE